MVKKSTVLMIVESPAKAKTISEYLKSQPENYIVLASYGHLRQLPRAKDSVKPDDDFSMNWEIQKSDHIKRIVDAAKNLDQNDLILLATDCDREGHAISYHIHDILKNSYKIQVPIKRILFQEITKNSIIKSVRNHLELDMDSVNSYFARIALDYLVGFNLSPILWTKLKGCKSAGRVQSAALRAIVDRDREVISFEPQEYWTLNAQFKINNYQYDANLISLYNAKVPDKLSQIIANDAHKNLLHEDYAITNIELKNTFISPKPPLITSTLQQASARILSWNASKTMKVAQSLYEGIKINDVLTGLITYMRTDSVRISDTALHAVHKYIKDKYDHTYLTARNYSTKNAQDAHEAIRPTDVFTEPDNISKFLTADQLKLYNLIWRYYVASQMSNMKLNVMTLKIASHSSAWLISEQNTEFKGYAILFPEQIKSNPAMYDIKGSDGVELIKLATEQHFTKSRGHFSEASLIKYLDEAGIGRPSTYASIVDTLESREYITRNNKQIIANPKGWLVIGLLHEFCPQYIDNNFTASMENELDEIASGNKQWKNMMHEFWNEFVPIVENGNKIDPKTISQRILDRYPVYFLGKDKKYSCEKCSDGNKVLCITSKSEFIGCSNYPTCNWIQNLNQIEDSCLGHDLETDEPILIKKGMYGHYLYWSVSKKKIGLSEKLLKNLSVETAMELKKMPIILGKHPTTDKDIKINVGRYGVYVMHDNYYASVSIEKIKYITIEDALELLGIAENKKKRYAKNT